MPWYAYKRGGWQIAVDAIDVMDAGRHIRKHAPGAQLQGEFEPPTWDSPSQATAMVTERRQAQISERAARERHDAGF